MTMERVLDTFARRKRNRPSHPGDQVSAQKTRTVGRSAEEGTGYSNAQTKKKNKKKFTQLHLDMGQKNFHSSTCKSCGFVYTAGDPEEERLHDLHHKDVLSLSVIKLKCVPSGCKQVADYRAAGGIYRLEHDPASPKSAMALISKHLEYELGCIEGWISKCRSGVLIYLDTTYELKGCVVLESNPVSAFLGYIKSNKSEISGKEEKCLDESNSSSVVVTKSSQCRSSRKRCQCAVRVIWTSKDSRRNKIASKMLDCARAQIISGQIIPRKNIAFSQPTMAGSRFIESYVQSSEFLVYDVE
eukprot:jgi/Picsp_1/4294/NSC_01803-R1_n-acetyltransferase esco1